jgi:hypothetical protein
VRVLVLALTVLLLAGCTGLVRSGDVYESKAATSAEAAGSAVETARLALDGALAGKAFGRTTAQLLAEAATEASSVQGTFDAIQPPDAGSDQLRAELDDLLDQAVADLESLRIAARRGDRAGLARGVTPLAGLSDKLDAFAEAHA